MSEDLHKRRLVICYDHHMVFPSDKSCHKCKEAQEALQQQQVQNDYLLKRVNRFDNQNSQKT